jgi:hypothetical protein
MSDPYWLTIDDEEGTTLVDDAAAREAGVRAARDVLAGRCWRRLAIDHVVMITDHAGRVVLSLTLGASVLSSVGARYDHAASVIRGDGPSSNMNASSKSATDTSCFQSCMVTAPARKSTSPRVLSSFKVRLT